jgi:hypothetical protein
MPDALAAYPYAPQLLKANQKPCFPSLRIPTTVIFCPIFGIIPPLNLTNAARSLCAAAATAHAYRAHAAVVQPMFKSIDLMANTVSLK